MRPALRPAIITAALLPLIAARPASAQPGARPPDDTAAAEAYRRRFIAFEDEPYSTITVDVSGPVARGTIEHHLLAAPYRGVQHEPLPGASFYDAIGRTDLAAAYRRRGRWRTALKVAGGLAMGTGLVLFADSLADVDLGCQPDDPAWGQCIARESHERDARFARYAGAGAITGLVGITALIVGHAIDPDPVAPYQRRLLARDYDRKLRDTLGLPPIEVSPYVVPGGAGVVAAGRF